MPCPSVGVCVGWPPLMLTGSPIPSPPPLEGALRGSDAAGMDVREAGSWRPHFPGGGLALRPEFSLVGPNFYLWGD